MIKVIKIVGAKGTRMVARNYPIPNHHGSDSAIGTCRMARNSGEEGNSLRAWPSFTSGEKPRPRLRHGVRFNQPSLFKSAGRDTRTMSAHHCRHTPSGQSCLLRSRCRAHGQPTSQPVPPFPVSTDTLPPARGTPTQPRNTDTR